MGANLKYHEKRDVILIVKVPFQGYVKEVVLRHPCSFNYTTSDFEVIELTDKQKKILHSRN